jgi:hypothetical protein
MAAHVQGVIYLTLFWSSMPVGIAGTVTAWWAGRLLDYAVPRRRCCSCRSRRAVRLSLRRWVIDRLMAWRGAGCGVLLTWVTQSPRAAVSKALRRGTSWTGIRTVPTQRSSCHTLSTSRSCSGCQVTRKPAPRWSMKTSRRVGRARTFFTAQAWAFARQQARPASTAAARVLAVPLPSERPASRGFAWSGCRAGRLVGASQHVVELSRQVALMQRMISSLVLPSAVRLVM